MRKILTLVIAVLFVAAAALAHHGPATSTIDEAKAKQPGVTFSHGKHATTYVKDCTTCHHADKGLTKDNDKNVKNCASCHLKAQGKMGTMADASLTKNPMHVLCIDCHKKQNKGPKTCTGCHKK